MSGEVIDFYERIEEYTKRPILFEYNVETQSMDTQWILNTNKEYMTLKSISLYNTFGYIVITQSFFYEGGEPTLLTFIDLNSMQKRSIRIEKGISLESNLFFINPDSIYYCVRLMETHKEKGFNKNLETTDFEPKDFNYAYIQGGVGTPIEDYEFLLLYNEKTNNNALHISKGYKQKVGPYLDLQPPKELYNAYSSALKSIRVNDNHSMMIFYDYSKPQRDKIGEKYFVIYDKMNKEWYQHTFKGNATNVRSYDNGWIAGTIADMDKGEYFDKTTMQYGDEYNFKRESPGYEERVPIFYERTDGLWGDCFDERMLYYGRYYPGFLYLFNVHTRDYIEWDTKQGDSEVLLVEDGYVYYRVNTKILKSAIIDNKNLNEPELLIDDVRVRDIHWAYLKKENGKQ
jgi:hypothetical protein